MFQKDITLKYNYKSANIVYYICWGFNLIIKIRGPQLIKWLKQLINYNHKKFWTTLILIVIMLIVY